MHFRHFCGPGGYHRGLMVGETPNIDRIANEGAIFTDYVAMQSCTSGGNAFFTGMYPLRTGMIPPQLPGSPSSLGRGRSPDAAAVVGSDHERLGHSREVGSDLDVVAAGIDVRGDAR